MYARHFSSRVKSDRSTFTSYAVRQGLAQLLRIATASMMYNFSPHPVGPVFTSVRKKSLACFFCNAYLIMSARTRFFFLLFFIHALPHLSLMRLNAIFFK